MRKSEWNRIASQRIKLSLATSDLGGGTGNHLVLLSNYFDEKYISLNIISSSCPATQQSFKAKIDLIPPKPSLLIFPLSVIRNFFHFANKIRKSKPHVLHSYFFWPIIYSRVLRRLGVVPILVENREDEGFEWSAWQYFLLRATNKIPDLIICVSKGVRDCVVLKEKVDPKKISVVLNGIELVNEKNTEHRNEIKEKWGITKDEFVVGMVANFNRAVKGVTYFIDAVPYILKKNSRVRFVLIGTGEEELELKKKAKKLGVDSQIIFTGYQTNVQPFYQIMDVSVLTSLSEGLSITLLESIKNGIPIVATNVGGNHEIVHDGINGFLVSPKDPIVFSEKVIEILNDDERRKNMGEKGKEIAREKFDIQNTANRYLEIYHSLLMNIQESQSYV